MLSLWAKWFLANDNTSLFTVATPQEQIPFSNVAVELLINICTTYLINLKLTSCIWIVLAPIDVFANNLLLVPNISYRSAPYFQTYIFTFRYKFAFLDFKAINMYWMLPACTVLDLLVLKKCNWETRSGGRRNLARFRLDYVNNNSWSGEKKNLIYFGRIVFRLSILHLNLIFTRYHNIFFLFSLPFNTFLFNNTLCIPYST